MSSQHEPIFNANQPWPPIALAAVIVGGFAVQSFLPDNGGFFDYAFAPVDLQEGRWITLISALFVHGSWSHALMNAAFALAFGMPVARYTDRRAGGAVAFFLFYLACGALSSAGYALVHPGQTTPLVGASGAVSGLAAASSRLIAGRGQMGSVLSPAVIGMGVAWLVVNLLVAVVGFAPGAGGAQVAWEAHIAGFLAGLALSQVLTLARPRQD